MIRCECLKTHKTYSVSSRDSPSTSKFKHIDNFNMNSLLKSDRSHKNSGLGQGERNLFALPKEIKVKTIVMASGLCPGW